MTDETYMRMALMEAEAAAEEGEVPVGAVITVNDRVIAKTHNLTERLNDVTAHAEMQAITSAAEALGGKYLKDCTIYVTVEPCAMCAGAIIQSRIKTVYFGASDPKGGAVISVARLFDSDGFCHKVEYHGGIEEERCSSLLSNFFKKLRKRKKRRKNWNKFFKNHKN